MLHKKISKFHLAIGCTGQGGGATDVDDVTDFLQVADDFGFKLSEETGHYCVIWMLREFRLIKVAVFFCAKFGTQVKGIGKERNLAGNKFEIGIKQRSLYECAFEKVVIVAM